MRVLVRLCLPSDLPSSLAWLPPAQNRLQHSDMAKPEGSGDNLRGQGDAQICVGNNACWEICTGMGCVSVSRVRSACPGWVQRVWEHSGMRPGGQEHAVMDKA